MPCPQTNPYPENPTPTQFKNQISPKGLALTSWGPPRQTRTWWYSPVTRKSNFHQSPDVFVGLTIDMGRLNIFESEKEAEYPTYLCLLPGDGHQRYSVQLSAAPSPMTRVAASRCQPRGKYRTTKKHNHSHIFLGDEDKASKMNNVRSKSLKCSHSLTLTCGGL